MKTRMQRPRVDVVGQAQLLDPAQARKVGVVDQVEEGCLGHLHKSVDRIIEDLMRFHLVKETIFSL